MLNVLEGWLKIEEDYNYHESIYLNDEPISEVLDFINGKQVTISYYISDNEASIDELQEDFLINTLYGKGESYYNARYSEYTGYLWTDDDLIIGGHDLMRELESYIGKYIILKIEVHD